MREQEGMMEYERTGISYGARYQVYWQLRHLEARSKLHNGGTKAELPSRSRNRDSPHEKMDAGNQIIGRLLAILPL